MKPWQQWAKILDRELDVETAKAPSPSEIHAKDHVLRVLKGCIELGKKLDGDLEVLAAVPEDRTSLESKILYDADKLDTLSVVGILRYIRRWYGRTSMDAILADIDNRWNGLVLPETRDLCQKDYEYIKDYFLRLKTELSAADREL